jgi:DNA polymerase-1
MQRSDWSGTLTDKQLAYAARDATVLRPLLEALLKKIAEAKLERTAEIEARCLPAVGWMASKGVAVDQPAWIALATKAREEGASLREQMTQLAPVPPGDMFATWNFDSPADVTRMFAALDIPIEDTTDETLAAIEHPTAGLLRRYREATKRLTTYGERWLRNFHDGRVFAHWNQLGAEASGRFSCSEPNLQQLPRDPAYRRCIIAPAGRVLVKADYSQIELRIAAKVSGDKAMLRAYQSGEDLHTRTARIVLGVEDVTKEHRQVAKSLNFGLLYGMGAPGLRVYAATNFGVKLTDEEAVSYRAAFFKSYPGLRSWHQRTGKTKDNAIATRTLAGRRRLDVTRFTEKLNPPVQGTGADGLKMALALLWERREQMPGAFPVLAVHDEIVVEADAGQADAAAAWVKQAMLDAMAPLIDPVPVSVDVQVSSTWGGGAT